LECVADTFIVHGAGIMWTLKDGELSIGGFLPGSAAFQSGARWGHAWTPHRHKHMRTCTDTDHVTRAWKALPFQVVVTQEQHHAVRMFGNVVDESCPLALSFASAGSETCCFL
jgi:hypothetical protein